MAYVKKQNQIISKKIEEEIGGTVDGTNESLDSKNKLKTALEKLAKERKSSYALKRLFERSAEGVRIIDASFTVVDANAEFLKLSGLSRDEVIGSKCYECFYGSKCHTEECTLKTIQRRDKRISVTIEKQRSDGNMVPCMLMAASVRDENGEFLGIVESFRDVSDLVSVKEEIGAKMQELFELQQLFEGSSDGIRVIDKGFNVIKINEPFLKMCGRSKEEVVGRKCYDVFTGKYCHTPQCPLVTIEKQDKRIEIEVEKERADGKKLSCLLVANSFKDANNEFLGIVESFRDIDELVKERTRSEIESWFKTGQNGLTEITRGDQDLTELSKNIVTYLAKYIEAQVGIFYFAEDGGSLKLLGSYAYANRKNISNRFQLGEGIVGQAALEKETIMVSDVPEDYVKINSGLGEASPRNIIAMPIYFEGVLYGVIELGSFKPLLEKHIQFLNSLIESIGIVINTAISRDKMKVLLQETRTQQEELKSSNEEMQSQQEELRASNEKMQSQQEKLEQANKELEYRARDLKVSQENIQKQNRSLEEQKGLLEGQRDAIEVQNRKVEQARLNIVEKANELELASKYKSEFLANMSHELRTPLNSLLILASSLAENDEKNLTEEQVESAKIIHSGGCDLLNLINDILDLSKVEAGKLEVVLENISAQKVADNLKRQFQPIAKNKKLKFVIDDKHEKDLSMRTDSNRLEQILKNFLSNAFKFTETGSVTIKIDLPMANERFKREHLTPSNSIVFKIIDTGIGIPKNKQEAIFEAFQQADGSTSRHHGGTGLGLSISRELAKLLGCEIKMESEVGKGSIFALYVPMEWKEDEPTDKDTKPIKEARTNYAPSIDTSASFVNHVPAPLPVVKKPFFKDPLPGEKPFLIIEDDVDFQNILLNLANERGYKAVIAKNGQDGIDLARRIKPVAISLDMGLPDIDGADVLRTLKMDSETRQIPVHVISGLENLLKLREKGAIGISKKPINMKGLSKIFDKIDTIIAGEIRHVLVVEDDEGNQKAIAKLIQHPTVKITAARTGSEAIASLKTTTFDTMILDFGLPDINGLSLLKEVRDLSDVEIPPVIVYTGRELHQKEYQELSEFTASFVLKGAYSAERLLDDLSLFLHTEKRSPGKKPDISTPANETLRSILKDKRVLLVDDDLRNTFALSGILKKYGLKVIMADNGKMALEKLENEPDIQLVIMDIMMPIMDGYEAMTKIRQQNRFAKLPIIALTAKVLPEDRRKAIECGANDFLTKPVDIKTLLETTAKWLTKSLTEQEFAGA